jgi:hypothetical protein
MIREGGLPAIDLSRINFEVLAQRFKKSKHKNTDLEALKAAIRARIEKLVRVNRTRADFAEKFEALIESYNAGSRNIEQLFEELLKLSKSLDEALRHIREKLTVEELVIFDILTRPAPELSTDGRTRRGQESGPGASGAAQAAPGAQLAEEGRGAVCVAARHRGRARLRPAAGLHAGVLPPEGLRRLRACLRELPGAECRVYAQGA